MWAPGSFVGRGLLRVAEVLERPPGLPVGNPTLSSPLVATSFPWHFSPLEPSMAPYHLSNKTVLFKILNLQGILKT